MNAMLKALFELYDDALFAHEAVYAAFDDGLINEDEVEIALTLDEEDKAQFAAFFSDYDENEARAHSKTDECQHEEKHWTEDGWVCSICYKPLSGIDYGQLADIERAYEEQREAEAKNFVPDGY